MKISKFTIKEAAFFEFSRFEESEFKKTCELAFYLGAKWMLQELKEQENREGEIKNLIQQPKN